LSPKSDSENLVKTKFWGPRQSRFLTVGSPTVGGSPAVTLSKSGLLEK